MLWLGYFNGLLLVFLISAFRTNCRKNQPLIVKYLESYKPYFFDTHKNSFFYFIFKNLILRYIQNMQILMYSLMNFHTRIHLCNHHPDQIIKHSDFYPLNLFYPISLIFEIKSLVMNNRTVS